MKLQLHGVVKITVKSIEEFTVANGKATSHDFRIRRIVIEDETDQKFEIDLFSDFNLDLTYD